MEYSALCLWNILTVGIMISKLAWHDFIRTRGAGFSQIYLCLWYVVFTLILGLYLIWGCSPLSSNKTFWYIITPSLKTRVAHFVWIFLLFKAKWDEMVLGYKFHMSKGWVISTVNTLFDIFWQWLIVTSFKVISKIWYFVVKQLSPWSLCISISCLKNIFKFITTVFN